MWPLPQQRHRTDVVKKIQKRPSMPSMPCLRKSVAGNHPTRAHLTSFFKHHPNQETNNRRWGYSITIISIFFCRVSLIGHSKKSMISFPQKVKQKNMWMWPYLDSRGRHPIRQSRVHPRTNSIGSRPYTTVRGLTDLLLHFPSKLRTFWKPF